MASAARLISFFLQSFFSCAPPRAPTHSHPPTHPPTHRLTLWPIGESTSGRARARPHAPPRRPRLSCVPSSSHTQHAYTHNSHTPLTLSVPPTAGRPTPASPKITAPAYWAGADSEAGRRPLSGRAGREAYSRLFFFFFARARARAPCALRPALTRSCLSPSSPPPSPPGGEWLLASYPWVG